MKRILREAANGWLDDGASSMGAALAYYTLFSLVPILLIAIAVAGLVFDEEAARGQIFQQLQFLMGRDGAAAVEGLLQSMGDTTKGLTGSLIGVAGLIFGATTVFAELQGALDRIWKAPAPAATSGIWSLLRSRVLSFGMILAIGFLLLVSLVFNAALAAWGTWTAPGGWEVVGQAINFIVGFVFTTAGFGLIYRYMPRVHLRWHDVWIGAALTSLLFTVGKLLISLYVGKSGVVSGFGAASSVVVLLVWIYYSAQIFLFGAELTSAYAHSVGSRRDIASVARPEEVAVPVVTAATSRPARSLARLPPDILVVLGSSATQIADDLYEALPEMRSIREAETAEEAWWLAGLQVPRVAVLDLDLDARQLARALRYAAVKKGVTTRIVAVGDNQRGMASARRSGLFNVVLARPVTTQTLLPLLA